MNNAMENVVPVRRLMDAPTQEKRGMKKNRDSSAR